jgi:hypothetical protein
MDKTIIDAVCTMMIEGGMSDLTLVDTVLDSRGFTAETRKKVADVLRAEVAS